MGAVGLAGWGPLPPCGPGEPLMRKDLSLGRMGVPPPGERLGRGLGGEQSLSFEKGNQRLWGGREIAQRRS